MAEKVRGDRGTVGGAQKNRPVKDSITGRPEKTAMLLHCVCCAAG
jgi:hypothetical protein